MKRALLLLLVSCPLLLILPAAAKDYKLPPIAVKASPQVVVSAPLETLSIEVTIPRDKKNRGFCVEVDGPNFFSSDCKDLQGENAPVIQQVYVLHLNDDGEYEVRGILIGENDKTIAVAAAKVEVGVVQASNGANPFSAEN